MIVVADTSPLAYLIQIGCESALPELFKKVLIPNAVLAELESPGAPWAVARWLQARPAWIEVATPPVRSDAGLTALDPGEREAIQLAEERKADLLLIDERRGRTEAMRRGLITTGTLGVLLASAERGLVDAEAAYHRLINETSFRSTTELRENFLRRVRDLAH